MRVFIVFIVLSLSSCGLFSSGEAEKTALEVVSPIASELLKRLIKERYDAETDEESAGCYPLPEFENEDDFTYIICRAKAQE